MEDQLQGYVAGLFLAFVLTIVFALAALMFAGLWKVLSKAGQPGWGALIPIYNLVLILRVAGRPDVWVLFFFIPGVNLVFQIIVSIDLVKSFGKDTFFAVGLIFFPVIFLPILGFGEARYLGPQPSPAASVAASPGPPQAPSSPT